MFETFLEEHISVIKDLLSLEDKIAIAINTIIESLKNGNKIIIMGNGGSASDSLHFAGEIVGRYKRERKGYPAISLLEPSIITAIANDYSYEEVFSRQVEALAEPGDIVFGISTSGNSKNVINGIKKAKEIGATTIGLLGKDGGQLSNIVDIPIIVPSDNTPRIQEAHIFIIHYICEKIEESF
ncbi:MAG TPA: D-sedoheptulose 7-phosphate isomerase [Spirochaetota bacterium]|nr:D-sedoheptulose 7-phosphate isomerase [Spirochaetota bacterium]HOM38183.1 D-sedoheptulose 7-phosphate isomerase [Spirochaetota bacterium]HPQ48599.1 D-sedoheptulose 7-phosphate isomerase [Spirochaetota bacterium]